jgi:hypothetical protein
VSKVGRGLSQKEFSWACSQHLDGINLLLYFPRANEADASHFTTRADKCVLTVVSMRVCAGVKRPAAVVVCHSTPELATNAVKSIKAAYSSVPIYACAQNFK